MGTQGPMSFALLTAKDRQGYMQSHIREATVSQFLKICGADAAKPLATYKDEGVFNILLHNF